MVDLELRIDSKASRAHAPPRTVRHSPKLRTHYSPIATSGHMVSIQRRGHGDTSTILYVGASLPDYTAAFLFPKLATFALFDNQSARGRPP